MDEESGALGGILVLICLAIIVEDEYGNQIAEAVHFVTHVVCPLILVIVALAVGIGTTNWLIEHRDGVQAFSAMMAEVFWVVLVFCHYLPVWLLLLLVRGSVVMAWPLVTSGVWERRLVILGCV